MLIYPAIDLIDGTVVRLLKGDFTQKTTYHTDPVEVAKSYRDQGAEWLHLVDLDGAKNPEQRQIDLIGKIIAGSGLKIQTGGGIRAKSDVAALIEAGASRVVIGSLAVRDPVLLLTLAAAVPGFGIGARAPDRGMVVPGRFAPQTAHGTRVGAASRSAEDPEAATSASRPP